MPAPLWCWWSAGRSGVHARVSPMLIVMSGLPGAGKSSVAEALGRKLAAPVVSVDPIEAAMWRAGVAGSQPTGLAAYVVAEAVADGVLALGQTVIVDAVNAVEAAREQWRSLADRHGVSVVFIEVVCSDPVVHRRRLEGRSRDLEGFVEPTWEAVERLREEFAPWADHRLVLDAVIDLSMNVATALGFLAAAT
ncbi:ATP-binding protein [Streptomyces sp. NBC_00154]|uniref:AAA family ATPase n=1 Tax=Streptomyces sp. NBC_00154 TaxID=2975670 RepID=UPI0022533906|nr:ATP-binding protein [Streptomyces sp. NBC_00154]MCX5318170.1 ATP-binding protein [Streptomyces sp. NBC_00154]